jgi:hypothetical protein
MAVTAGTMSGTGRILPRLRGSRAGIAGETAECRKMVLPDRIELSTSPLPMVGPKVRKPYLSGVSYAVFEGRTDFAQVC